MKRVILHIGTHKTGTTSLQQFLYANAGRLREDNMCYPRTRSLYKGIRRARNGHFLYRYATARTVPLSNTKARAEATAANLKSIRRKVRRFDTVILSDERLWYEGALRPQCWELVKEALGKAGADVVDIVVYLRRQDLFVASLWNQWVKGSTRLSETLPDFVQRDSSIKVMDYDAGLKALESVFGLDHLTVRVFERDRLVEGDVRRDFCSFAGIPLEQGYVIAPIESNPSLNRNIAELKRIANGLESYAGGDDFLHDHAIAASLASAEKRAPAVPLDLRREMFARYEAGNAHVARHYLGREDGSLFDMSGAFDPDPDFDADACMQDMARLLCGAIAEEHAARLAAEKRADGLEKRIDALVRRADGLNASLGILARVRRRMWRRRMNRS